MDEALEENTCRICRGEATPSSPLFHPCKCRGSIKYIHQDCLEEWLKHSNKKDATCDICHEQYKFTTVYNPDTPEVAPVSLILSRWKQRASRWIRYSLSVVALVVGFAAQIPLFWAVVTRFLTYTLNNVPVHGDFFVSLVYGDAPFTGDPWSWNNLVKTWGVTFVESLATIACLLVVNLSLFVVNERVRTDPGFKRMVDKDIGDPLRQIPKRDGGLDLGPIMDHINVVNGILGEGEGDDEERQRRVQRQVQRLAALREVH